jgi:hypothetical protein
MRLVKGRAKHATERQRGEACEPLIAKTFAKAHSLRDCFALPGLGGVCRPTLCRTGMARGRFGGRGVTGVQLRCPRSAIRISPSGAIAIANQSS